MGATAFPLRDRYGFCPLAAVEISSYVRRVLIMKLPGVKIKFVLVETSILPVGIA